MDLQAENIPQRVTAENDPSKNWCSICRKYVKETEGTTYIVTTGKGQSLGKHVQVGCAWCKDVFYSRKC